ncbi:hypothetical protein KIN20_036755 [Parelaphostrongylus tenuis]|uniref:Uncharacterized protein n=1 Tax=Parelaphostrongylus tenuis TaxID=148309 RepID=A0AAD5WKT6_PARTN|nr:hypothetical protein KIN20_036755 [Parelaphostrongylus tenuis]
MEATGPSLRCVEGKVPDTAYSPDAATSDYGIYRSMDHSLRECRFEVFDQVEEACQELLNRSPRRVLRADPEICGSLAGNRG